MSSSDLQPIPASAASSRSRMPAALIPEAIVLEELKPPPAPACAPLLFPDQHNLTADRLREAVAKPDPIPACARELERLTREDEQVVAGQLQKLLAGMQPAALGQFAGILGTVLVRNELEANENVRAATVDLVSAACGKLEDGLCDDHSSRECARLLGVLLHCKESGPRHERARASACAALLEGLADPHIAGECREALLPQKGQSLSPAGATLLTQLGERLASSDLSLRNHAAFCLLDTHFRLKEGGLSAKAQALLCLDLFEKHAQDLLQGMLGPSNPNSCSAALAYLVAARPDTGEWLGPLIVAALVQPELGGALIEGWRCVRNCYRNLVSRAVFGSVTSECGVATSQALFGQLVSRPVETGEIIVRELARMPEAARGVFMDELLRYGTTMGEPQKTVRRLLEDRPQLLVEAAANPVSRIAAIDHLRRQLHETGRPADLLAALPVFNAAVRSMGLDPRELIRPNSEGKGVEGVWPESGAPESLAYNCCLHLNGLARLEEVSPGAGILLRKLCGLRCFGRYSNQMLSEQAALLSSSHKPSGGLVGVFYPVGDYNGAFLTAAPLISLHEQARALGGRLVITESEHPFRLIGNLMRLSRRLGRFDVVVLGGHGLEDGTGLALRGAEHLNSKHIRSERLLESLREALTYKPSILFFSCNTGMYWGIAEQSATFLSSIEAGTYGPPKPAYLNEFKIQLSRGEAGNLSASVDFGTARTRQFPERSTWRSFIRAIGLGELLN